MLTVKLTTLIMMQMNRTYIYLFLKPLHRIFGGLAVLVICHDKGEGIINDAVFKQSLRLTPPLAH